MDDAATGRHPLHAARRKYAFAAMIVVVLEHAFEHVGYRLEAAMRMVGKSGDVLVGLVRAERVEHQERIETLLQVLRENARQLDAGAVTGWNAADDTFDGARYGFAGHGRLLSNR